MKPTTRQRLKASTGTTIREIQRQVRTSNGHIVHFLESQGRVKPMGKRLIREIKEE